MEDLVTTHRFWNGKRVLVTGCTGFKGSWLAYWLTKMGATVAGLSLPPEGTPNLFDAARLSKDVEQREVDIRDEARVAETVRASRCEIIFHLAAQSLVRVSYDRPIYTYAVNAMGTAYVLEATRGSAVRAVVCVTTDKCYENREWLWPYRESEPLGGFDPYSSSKACAEIVASAYSRSFLAGAGIGVATARGGNVIGGGDWSPDRIVPDLVRAFAARERAIVRNPNAMRPWQAVLDALNGYLQLAERLHREPETFSQAWNFGPNSSADLCVAAFADRLRDAWGEGAEWVHRPQPGAVHEATLLRLDSSKARALLGWRDLVSTHEAVARLARWYSEFYRGADARALMESDIADFEAKRESL